MKRSSRELKALARDALKGHYGTMIGAIVLMFIISGLLNQLPGRLIPSDADTLVTTLLDILLTLIISILTYLVEIGVFAMALHMVREEPFGIKQLFYAVGHGPNRFIIAVVIQMIISQIPLLPAILYGQNFLDLNLASLLVYLVLLLAGYLVSIVITLGFALSNLLLIEDENMGAIESIRQSFSLMKGNKGRYFYLEISFFGLFLLSALSLFIGLLWIMPYMITTEVFFYLDVTGELDQTYTEYEDSAYGFQNDHWSTANEYDRYNTEA